MEKNLVAEKKALEVALESPCSKRKVGAVIVDIHGIILSSGYNHNFGLPCEDYNSKTFESTIHAEVAAIGALPSNVRPKTIYVTHPPCSNCQQAIKDAGIIHTVVVEQFMKFDTGKLRYDLIPPSATKALAEVLTYGAKKYKPNNWQQADDIERYIAAAFRHFELMRAGEEFDEESGLRHSAHLMTNIAFINYFETLKS